MIRIREFISGPRGSIWGPIVFYFKVIPSEQHAVDVPPMPSGKSFAEADKPENTVNFKDLLQLNLLSTRNVYRRDK